MVKELSDSLPSIEQLLQGLHARRGTSGPDLLPGLALFGAGLLVGAGLALLFAPASGEETRGQIGERLNEVRDRINGARAEADAS